MNYGETLERVEKICKDFIRYNYDTEEDREKNAEAVSMQIKTMIENATYEKMKKELIKGCD